MDIDANAPANALAFVIMIRAYALILSAPPRRLHGNRRNAPSIPYPCYGYGILNYI